MSLINVEGIRVYAYHGHLPEEAILGGHFIVNVWIDIDALEVEKSSFKICHVPPPLLATPIP